MIWDDTFSVWLKCENEQVTGSFKARGALSKGSQLTSGQTVVTASTGNHGLGVAYAAERFGLIAIVFVPTDVSKSKLARLKEKNIEIRQVEGDSLAAELAGKAFATAHHLPWISPYNDPDVIAGQGTMAREISEQQPHVDKIYVTVGGGGLISGIAGWYKYHFPETGIIGCQPVHSPEMYLSVMAGHVVEAPESRPTLSDGSAGPLEMDSITFDMCADWIDRFVLVTESEIEDAIRHVYHQHQLVIEGAAGVALAAAIQDDPGPSSQIRVVVLCGGNIDPLMHAFICGY